MTSLFKYSLYICVMYLKNYKGLWWRRQKNEEGGELPTFLRMNIFCGKKKGSLPVIHMQFGKKKVERKEIERKIKSGRKEEKNSGEKEKEIKN